MESSEKILTMLQRIEVSLELMEKRIDQLEKNTVQSLPVPNGLPETVCSPPSKKAFGYGKSSRYTLIESRRREVLRALSIVHDISLTRSTKTLFYAGTRRYCISISSLTNKRFRPYIYSYCPEWHEYLQASDQGFMVLGMLDRNEAYAIPVSMMAEILPHLSETSRHAFRKWNLTLALNREGELLISLPDSIADVELSAFRFSVV